MRRAGTRRANERHAKGVTVLLDSARVDPAAAEMLQASVCQYRETLDALAGRLEEVAALEPSDRRRAGDVFWYLFGWTSWRTLTIDLAWSWDEAEQWLVQRGVEALLGPESRKM
jgi:hypothetical protein